MKYFFISALLILFLSFISCKKKEKIVEVEKEVIVYQEPTLHWNLIRNFDNYPTNKNVGNAKNANGLVVFAGSVFSLYDSIQDKYSFGYNILSNELQKTPLITNDFWVSCSSYGNILYINPLKNVFNNGFGSDIQFYLSIKNYDKKFNSFYFPNINWWQHPEIISTEKNKISILTSDSAGFPTIYCLKINVIKDQPFNGSVTIDTTYIKKIKLPAQYLTSSIGTIGENSFYRMSNVGIYKIDYKNDTNLVLPRTFQLYDIFKNANKYYAIGQEVSTIKLFSTLDSGLTWQEDYTNLKWDTQSLNYFEFDNKVLATINSQIFEVQIGSTLIFKEINNEGIKNNVITSIVKCNNKVFLTTNFGVYICNYSNFYQYK